MSRQFRKDFIKWRIENCDLLTIRTVECQFYSCYMISDIAEIHLHNATYYENLLSEHKMVLSFTLGKTLKIKLT